MSRLKPSARNTCNQGFSRTAQRLGSHDNRKQTGTCKNIFVFGQCMEGTQFYGLFGMILSLARQNKFPGIGQMFRYTLRDESNHIELFRNLFRVLIDENPDIWTEEFKNELVELMKEAVELEKEFIRDCLPIRRTQFRRICSYIDYIADRRLVGVGLEILHPGQENPFLGWPR